MKYAILSLAVVLALFSCSLAQEAHDVSSLRLAWGGDLRLRQEMFDDIPIIANPPGVTRGGKNNFFRIRSRLWGAAQWDNLKLRGRLINEFRHVIDPDGSSPWDWPDEIIVDQLFLDIRDLLDGRVDIRAGRQDLLGYGGGRILLEGTPKDGSRSIFFDAVKLTFKADEANRVDFLGIYNHPEARLEIGHYDRDNTGFDGNPNDLTESGLGFYSHLLQDSDIPLELYYLTKKESNWKGKPDEGGKQADMPGRRIHTVGTRLLPRLNDNISFELETAGQWGHTYDGHSTRGIMAYGGGSYQLDDETCRLKPIFTASLYYLSGDDPKTGRDEGWNPLWARYPQFSDLYVYAWDAEKAGYWTNILYPSLTATFFPARGHVVSFSGGPMYAPEKNGSGDGHRRGNFYFTRYSFTIGSNLLHSKDSLSGHIQAEMLDPGSYYANSHTAYFLRWELLYSF